MSEVAYRVMPKRLRGTTGRGVAATLRSAVVACAIAGAVAYAQDADAQDDAYLLGDASDPLIERLIAEMTLEEKVGQLSLYPTGFEIIDPNPANPVFRMTPPEQRYEDIRAGRVAGIFNGHGTDYMREVQTLAVEESRLGIPLIFGADVIHGYRTVFPVPLAEAASFNVDLVQETARIAAVEATAVGINWNFAPMVDLGRDGRWGRIVETAGEDVHLSSVLAAARVRGFQGDDLAAPDTLVATPKHFVGYGAAEGGLDYNTAEISERTLREHHLPPFKAAFDAGALAAMSAFHDNAGIPATADRALLWDTLRGEWSFGGFVVSDFNSDIELVAHGYAEDARDAARLAFLAGTDMSMNSGIYMEHLPSLVADGEVPIARINDAVRRVLTVKKQLGLFDDPYRYINAEREAADVRAASHLAAARTMAQQAVVMLKNDGALPLSDAAASIALIGPFAGMPGNLNGTWAIFGDNDESVSVEAGLRARLGADATLSVTRGSDYGAAIDGGLDAARRAAREAGVVILMLGETEGQSGEAKSRADTTLPPAQVELARAVLAEGTPTIILLTTGRPLALDPAVLDASAVLVTWFLGSEGGHAVADLLFGDVGPSGRLPVSFPRATGQEPLYYNRRPTGRGDTPERQDRFKTIYIDQPRESLFAFGHGLTYGDVTYGETTLSTNTMRVGDAMTVTAEVTNQGDRPATEVVQLYVRDRAASVAQPIRALKDFRRVELAPGQTERVRFSLTADDLAFLGTDMKSVIESGAFEVWIAPSAIGGTPARFTLE